jgi:hypothetical protein
MRVHQSENNSESQLNLFENMAHFSEQCLTVLKLLKQGKRLTVRDALIEYDIHSLPRRILDLKENGIPVKDSWKGKIKEYYL